MGLQTITNGVLNAKTELVNMAPALAVILIILGGMVFGFAQTQPAEGRGKYTTAAVSMIIGGIVIAAISGAAEALKSTGQGLLT